MSMSTNAKTWWTLFSSCAMVVSTFDNCPLCFLFSILVNRVRALVLLADGVSVFYVQYIVLYAGAVLFIVCLCLFFLCLWLAIFYCSKLGTAGVDIVGNC